ncbi:transcriptional regulator [Brachymonas sp.]|uniref:transcriptional regulator n=1 Tax=Brachymonas sp. TaxID=1936292 RepID=UPI0035B4CD44
MEKLLSYLNALKGDERDRFLKACGTSEGYLRKACSVGQVLGALLCTTIERVSKESVTRADLRPDDYWLIWPDLPAPVTPREAGHA